MDFQLFATIHSTSKYVGQDEGQPFIVTPRFDPAGYCWSGNHNQYRTSDLAFWVKNRKSGELVPFPMFASSIELFCRLAVQLENFFEQKSGGTLWDQDYLYQLGQTEEFGTLRRILAMIPESEPRCGDCGRTAQRCECVED